MSEILGKAISLDLWVILPAIVAATAACAFLVNTVILRAVKRIAEKTSTQVDDRIYRLLERYLFPLLTIAGILVLMDSLPLPTPVLQLANRLFVFAALLLLLFLLTKGTLLLIRGLESHYEPIRNIIGPIETGAKILFIAVGGMILIDNLGISLTPIITTLGVGSLAVAIALQDTLGNVFAGLYVKADRPIKVGHYIRLESGQEGYVDRIGWRSTHIRALQNNLIVVPNSKLAQTIITNFHLPEKRMSLLIPVSVSYDSDPQRVEEILVEEAKNAVGKVDGLLGEPQPFVRFIPGFGDFSLNFTLICQVREFTDQYWVQHELRKRIFKRLGREGMQEAIGPLIHCAFPMSTRSLQH